MRPRVKVERAAEQAFKVGDSMKEALRGVEESLQGMKLKGAGSSAYFSDIKIPSGWFGGSGSAASGSPAAGGSAFWDGAFGGGYPGSSKASPKPTAAPPTPSAPSAPSAPSVPSAPVPASPKAPEADDAMRRHCAALERLVEMGVSPQAAKVALRHLDAWLVGPEGEAEMAAAEAAADQAGEPILHLGDSVRLEGLVKNKDANGKVGTLEAYGADSQRWKVVLTDGQTYWVRPKLLRPLELRRLPLPGPSASRAPAGGSPGQASELAGAWAALEARQAAWREEQEAREIQLLEREESLRQIQEALDIQEHELALPGPRAAPEAEESRRAEEQELRAQELSALVPGGGTVSGGLVISGPQEQPPLEEFDDEEEAEADEMWDMDWSAMGASGPAAGGPPGALGARQLTDESVEGDDEPARAPAEEESEGKRRLAEEAPSGDAAAVGG